MSKGCDSKGEILLYLSFERGGEALGEMMTEGSTADGSQISQHHDFMKPQQQQPLFHFPRTLILSNDHLPGAQTHNSACVFMSPCGWLVCVYNPWNGARYFRVQLSLDQVLSSTTTSEGLGLHYLSTIYSACCLCPNWTFPHSQHRSELNFFHFYSNTFTS